MGVPGEEVSLSASPRSSCFLIGVRARSATRLFAVRSASLFAGSVSPAAAEATGESSVSESDSRRKRLLGLFSSVVFGASSTGVCDCAWSVDETAPSVVFVASVTVLV